MTDMRPSFPGHRFRKIGSRLVEDPFALVMPRDGRLPRCVSVTLDGTPVAWEFCAGCGQHVAICTHDVPIEPAYITRMRTGVELEASYSTAVSGTAVQRSESRTSRTQFSGKGVAPGIAISDLVTADVVAGVKAAKEARDGSP